MISEWSGNPSPLSPDHIQVALHRLRVYRSEVASRLVSTEGHETKLSWHRDKIIALSFWYEVSLHLAPSPFADYSPA
jgi:hypothetical protein